MSFLPYDQSRPRQWAAPLTLSLTLHAAAIGFVLTAPFAKITTLSNAPTNAPLIRLEILDLEGMRETLPLAANPALDPPAELAPTTEIPESFGTPDSLAEGGGAPEGDNPNPSAEASASLSATHEDPQDTDEEKGDLVATVAEAEAPEDGTPEPIPDAPQRAEGEPAEITPPERIATASETSTPPSHLQPFPLTIESEISPLAEPRRLPTLGAEASMALAPFESVSSAPQASELESAPPLAGGADQSVRTTEATPLGRGVPIANPSEAMHLVAALMTRIRSVEAEPCTLALPRLSAQGRVGLSLIGTDRDALSQYGADLSQDMPTPVSSVLEVIDPRQCAALDALALAEAYPASRIGFQIETTTLVQGEPLSARISGAQGLDIAVLLIDDNGVVQDLSRFVTFDADTPVLSVPVMRSGESRETRQLLMVLGTSDGPLEFTDMEGRTAQDIFARLSSERLAQIAFALTTFDVR